MEYSFSNSLFEWRGPAPFYFLRVSQEMSDEIKVVSNEVSYGWGVIPITGQVDGFAFTTALIPREGVYYLPIKMARTLN